MNTRYIRRFSLPERLYTAKSPVIIRAGALLEDTQTPRLVVQLKIMNISQKPVSSVGVHIRSFSEDGTETGGTEFYYRGLRAKRGQSFGQYTAVVLPESTPRRFTATVRFVLFSDGSRWNCAENAEWLPLPGFEPAGDLPTTSNAKYMYSEYADLWYCTCGGVNRDREAECHRCGKLRFVLSRNVGAAEVFEPSPEIEHEPVREIKAEPELGPKTNAESPEIMPAVAAEPVKEAKPVIRTQVRREIKKGTIKKLLLACACVAVIAAGVILIPKIFKGDAETPEISPPEISGTMPTGSDPQSGSKTENDAPALKSGFPQPTLPEPVDLRWGIVENVPHLSLMWDLADGLAEDDCNFLLEYSENGGQWEIGGWNNRTGASVLYALLGNGRKAPDGEYKFRITCWQGESRENITAVSQPAELDIPLTITRGSSSFEVESATFIAGINSSDNIVSVYSGSITNGNRYLAEMQSPVSNGKSTVYAGGSQAETGRLDFQVRDRDYSAQDSTVTVWEITEQTIVDGKPSITVSAPRGPFPILPHDGGAVRQPQVSNIRFEHSAPEVYGVLSLIFDVPEGVTEQTLYMVEYRRDSGEHEQFSYPLINGLLPLYMLDEPGVYSDFRIVTRPDNAYQRNSAPTEFGGTLTVRVSGEPLPLSAANITSRYMEYSDGLLFHTSLENAHTINPGRMSIMHVYADYEDSRTRENRNPVAAGSHGAGTGMMDENRIPDTARVTLQDYAVTVNGNAATVTLSPPQNPAITVPEPPRPKDN